LFVVEDLIHAVSIDSIFLASKTIFMLLGATSLYIFSYNSVEPPLSQSLLHFCGDEQAYICNKPIEMMDAF